MARTTFAKRALTLALTIPVALAAVAFAETRAEACGGCFHPPDPERPTVVTDHRMVLAVGRGESTLYDQIRYTGNPREFAWVLPIAGEVEVGLSSDGLFAGLDAISQTEIFGPPRNCPSRPVDCGGSGACGASFESASAGDFAGESTGNEVTVTRREVVGPYETVQLQSKDPGALTKWLGDNGFVLAADVRPIVEQYVRENFNFLALKLRPSASVQSMRPVRVTSKGPSIVLPLRMVAAGAGASVGITLFTMAEGRYEPQNFPFFQIAAEDVSWDWTGTAPTTGPATSSTTDGQSNFRDVRKSKSDAFGGRAWEVESSLEVRTGAFPVPAAPFGGATPEPSASAAGYTQEGTKIPDILMREDLDILYGRRSGGLSRLTRMRADLSKAALSEDLVLAASADQAVLSNQRRITRELNEPSCTVWVGCEAYGVAPRSEAVKRSTDHCATSGTATPNGGVLAAGLGLAAVVGARLRRRRAPRS
ncbi:MAG: DUF2330 domain-containing protein [Myxococcales bacterium]|nr:DUF2330 domain-containing protein [Myxococcales bacterium]